MSSCGYLIAGEVPSAPLLVVKWVQSRAILPFPSYTLTSQTLIPGWDTLHIRVAFVT